MEAEQKIQPPLATMDGGGTANRKPLDYEITSRQQGRREAAIFAGRWLAVTETSGYEVEVCRCFFWKCRRAITNPKANKPKTRAYSSGSGIARLLTVKRRGWLEKLGWEEDW